MRKELKDLNLSEYYSILRSGMLWVYYPNATGIAAEDIIMNVNSIVQLNKDYFKFDISPSVVKSLETHVNPDSQYTIDDVGYHQFQLYISLKELPGRAFPAECFNLYTPKVEDVLDIQTLRIKCADFAEEHVDDFCNSFDIE